MMEEPSTSSSGSNPFADYKERELLGHKRRCTTLGWSADGRKLASGKASPLPGEVLVARSRGGREEWA